jgi:hypothetical protein
MNYKGIPFMQDDFFLHMQTYAYCVANREAVSKAYMQDVFHV